MNVKTFARQLNSVLLDNAFDRVIPNMKSGKLNTRKLYKYGVGSEKLFKKKKELKGKEYSIMLLVDESGSMTRGERIEIAGRTALFLGKSLESININFAIHGFNEITYKHKTFEDKKVDDKILDYMRYECGGHFGTTFLAKAMEKAYKELNKQSGEKILLVFTDGSPSAPSYLPYKYGERGYGDDNEIRKHVKQIVKKNKNIKTIGVGIQDTNVRKIYSEYIVVDDLDEFQKKVIAKIKQNIKRGF